MVKQPAAAPVAQLDRASAFETGVLPAELTAALAEQTRNLPLAEERGLEALALVRRAISWCLETGEAGR